MTPKSTAAGKRKGRRRRDDDLTVDIPGAGVMTFATHRRARLAAPWLLAHLRAALRRCQCDWSTCLACHAANGLIHRIEGRE